MRSHQLAQLLLEKPDVELIMQKDAEGNGYSPCSGVDFDVIYRPETTYYGTVYDTSWSAEEADLTEHEWEFYKKTYSGYAVLFPVN